MEKKILEPTINLLNSSNGSISSIPHLLYSNCFRTMSKKSVVSVDLLCSKCKKKVMMLIAGIEGINSIVLDSTKSTATVIGDADPVQIIKKVRKFKKSAGFVSIGPPKVEDKKDELKKDIYPYVPKTCQKCDVWYVVGEEYNHCSIL